MIKNAKYVHTNIVSENWEKLSEFYIKVFGCIKLLPERDLHGKWIEEGTGIPDAHIKGIHLRLPGYVDSCPTLEIFQYENNVIKEKPEINQAGIAHLAFLVEDVEEALKIVIAENGSQLGKVVTKEIPEVGKITFVYAKDPEGNILELQSWE